MNVQIERVPWTPQLYRVMAGLMVSLFVAAMDSTVVGTALPTIARDLGSFQLYPWIVAGYLITATTTVPLWGRLADLHGRRRVLLVGIVVFIVASALCATSPSMIWLIAFRTLQGIGAGCIQPLVFTILGDIFPLKQRAPLSGLFSSMWAIAAIIGPALGAIFVSTIGWRWIFLINLPLGVVATALVWGYKERRPEKSGVRRLDVRGSLLLTAGVVLLLVGLGAGSQSATPNWLLVVAAVVVLALFARVEWGSASPTVPLDLLRNRIIGPAIAVGALMGTVMFGITTYVPLWVQEVQGGSPFDAGAAVGAMSIGWPVVSALAGIFMVRIGYQRLVVAGSLALVVGTLMLAVGSPDRGFVWTGAASLVIGSGMGAIAAPLLIVIQNIVEWSRRGAATALNQFSRTIGGAVGVSLMGVLLQGYVNSSKDPLGARVQLQAGLHADFVVLVVLAALMLAIAIAILVVARRADKDKERVAAAAGSVGASAD
ncbi:MAG TPA: MDR family MFS transporter [Candidatus Micrarchaeaceae archaeon]|nr:MDR family MFS transporter [Candidatus Micrarchaeaceae archaeon]